MKHSFIFSSNTLRLNASEWILTAILLLLAAAAAPRLWRMLETAEFGPDHRIPYASSYDYWLVSRRIEQASAEYPAVILGDSVIWGHYVGPDATLSSRLNALLDAPVCANLGVDAIHPAAMEGLLRYYGKSLQKVGVLLHLNLLWMSSRRHDLRLEEGERFNHPRLVSHTVGHSPDLHTRIEVWAERHLDCISWIRHLRQAYFENMDLAQWTMMHPAKNPFKALSLEAPSPEPRPRGRPVSWIDAGIDGGRELDWVALGESIQWASFRNTVRLLQQRGNRVFILIGPFNLHMLSDDNAGRYGRLLDGALDWLEREGIPHHVFSLLPTELFADASHPLEDGYRLMAEELLSSEEFPGWLKALPVIPGREPASLR